MREFAILPPEAVSIISRSKLKELLAKNIEVERPKVNADSLAELVVTDDDARARIRERAGSGTPVAALGGLSGNNSAK
jgi:hypothetical protein